MSRPQSPYNSHPDVAAKRRTIDARCRTAVGEANLRIGQVDLRDALRTFSARHAPLMDALRLGCLWHDASLTPARPFTEVTPVLDVAAGRLVALLSDPYLAEAIDGRAGPIDFEGDDAGPRMSP